KDGFVTPELMAWEQSGLVLLMVILGGMASLGGAVIGTVTLVLMQELFQSQALFGDYARHWHLPLGIAIIALVALLPNGIAGLPAQWRSRRDARRAGAYGTGEQEPNTGDSHARAARSGTSGADAASTNAPTSSAKTHGASSKTALPPSVSTPAASR
ncbi:MAG: branched-chain amino acid ABC transporter permease, partial [Achromobacter piechaudii]